MASPPTQARRLRIFVALHCLAISGSFIAAMLVAATLAAHPEEPVPTLAIAERAGETTPGPRRDEPIAGRDTVVPLPKWARVDDPPPPWATDR